MDMRDEIIEAIKEAGFDEYKEIDPKTDIVFSEAVFASCAENKCGNYGKNYSCPPLSGDMEENKARFLKYEHAIIINKIADMGKRYEKMAEAGLKVKEAFEKLGKLLEDKPVMLAGAGGCSLCKKCAAQTGEPCRFPDKRRYSMEGSGMDIVKMSIQQKMTYNGGDNKLGFFMMVLY